MDRPVFSSLWKKPDEVAGITHLSEEEGDYDHLPLGEIRGDDLRFSDTVAADQHHILRSGCAIKEFSKLPSVNF